MVKSFGSVCSQQLLIMFIQPENPARTVISSFTFYQTAHNIIMWCGQCYFIFSAVIMDGHSPPDAFMLIITTNFNKNLAAQALTEL